MYEVELKAKCSEGSFPLLSEYLADHGYVRIGSVRQEDDYYNHPARNFAESDEALRLRYLKPENGAAEAVITYKGANHSDTGQSREELETPIEDPAVMRRILERLGFVPVAPVYKTRTSYRKGGITICLDSVDGLGDYIEIEQICEETMRDEAQATIDAVLDELNFIRPVLEHRTYLELLLRKKGISRR